MNLQGHLLGAAMALAPLGVAASPLHVHDADGVLGIVVADTGAVSVIGPLGVTLTDIAFDPTGALFGLSFDDLYAVDPETAATTLIGPHDVPAGNALVFGEDGTLYAAGNASGDLFTIDPDTGATTALGFTGFASGGDLAFVGNELFLASSDGELVEIDPSGTLQGTPVGAFGVPEVFGIATDDESALFGVGGTTIFSVDLATGAAVDPLDFGGQGLGNAFGQSFQTEAGAPPVLAPIPVPASALLLGAAVMGLGAAGRRRS